MMFDAPKPSLADLCDINAARAATRAAQFEQILLTSPEDPVAIGMRDFHHRDVRFWQRRAAEYREQF